MITREQVNSHNRQQQKATTKSPSLDLIRQARVDMVASHSHEPKVARYVCSDAIAQVNYTIYLLYTHVYYLVYSHTHAYTINRAQHNSGLSVSGEVKGYSPAIPGEVPMLVQGSEHHRHSPSLSLATPHQQTSVCW